MNKEIINFCLEKGLLIDKEVLMLFESSDVNSIKVVIEKIQNHTQKRVITRSLINENKDVLGKCLASLPTEIQKDLETLKIKLGLSIEISKEKVSEKIELGSNYESNVRVLSNFCLNNKKLEVKDFVNYFRERFNSVRSILQEHSELKNLVSIDKISSNKQGISVIGLVSDKSVTKNQNVIFEIEDLTGKTKVLINQNKPELLEKAEEIPLDSVIGFKCSGSREILFANDIVFPESMIPERKRSFVDESAVFIGDLHYGSQLFMEENFLKFIDYLNCKHPGTEAEARKIKYLFIVGDLIAGVGNYPNQEEELKVKNLEEQFIGAANLLSKIRKDIKIIISPGNHDAVRIMEPQPMFDENFAWSLYDLPNVVVTTNPSTVNIGALPGFEGFNILTYHGYSFFYYVDNITPLLKAKASHSPELIMRFLLKHRHLAPTHGSNQYFPGEVDCNLIRDIPDILVSGHLHKSGINYYNNILIISVSTWEAMTAYMEKVGSQPDFCKVPMINLKTRAIKILDFE